MRSVKRSRLLKKINRIDYSEKWEDLGAIEYWAMRRMNSVPLCKLSIDEENKVTVQSNKEDRLFHYTCGIQTDQKS